MRWLTVASLLLASAAVQSQTVYRCGPDGRVYSQTACPQGQAIDVSDERSTQQREAALERARLEKAHGDQLERERIQRESARTQRAGKIETVVRPAAPGASGPHPKTPRNKRRARPEPERFKAVSPTQTGA